MSHESVTNNGQCIRILNEEETPRASVIYDESDEEDDSGANK